MIFNQNFVTGMIVVVAVSWGVSARADQAWSGDSDNNWTTAGNWVGGAYPGSTSGTVNPDIASFTNNPSNKSPVFDVANINLGGLLFDTGAGSFTIGTVGGNAVLLSSGGAITVKAGNTVPQAVNAPLVIQNANGSGAGAYTNLNYSAGTLTLGGTINGAATAGNTTTLTFGGFRTNGSDTISGVISDGLGGGKLALTVGTDWGAPNDVSYLGGGRTLTPLAGTWFFSGNNDFTGPTAVSAGSARLSGTTGRFSATGSLTVNGNATFYNGDASSANNSDISDRVNPSATLTLGGNNGGGTFQMASPATGKTHSQSFVGLTVGAGQSTISSSAATGTNMLTFTGTGGSVYSRNTGGIINFRSSVLTNSFSNEPTGVGVSGSGGSQILIGAVLDGTNFVKASSGRVGPAAYVTTMTADANVNVTGGNLSSGTLSINSLKFSDAAARTNTISGTLIIASGGILTGQALTTGSAVITGGSLTSGMGDLWIYANGSAQCFGGNLTGDPRFNKSVLTIASKITGANALTISGNGSDNMATGQQVTLSNTNNDYSGGTFLAGGKIVIAADGSLGAANGTVTAVSGINVINPSVALTNNSSRNFVINGGATLYIGQIANASIAGKVSGSGTLGASWYGSSMVLELTGDNSEFNGCYQVNGNLRVASGVLSTNANLAFLGTSEGSGYLETIGTFTRPLGLGAGQVQWGNHAQGFGGFSARGGPLTVNIGGATVPDTLTWGSNYFMTSVNGLNLQNANADSDLTFTNNINFNGAARSITVTSAGTTKAIVSGALSGTGASALTKSGTGLLVLTGENTYSGVTTINAGVLRTDNALSLPGGTGALTFNGGVFGLGTGDFTRGLGAAGTANAVNFTGNGGWAAYGADRNVNIGGALDTISWSAADTGFNGKILILSATTATHAVEVQNPLDLGTALCAVQTDNGAATVDGILSGLLSGSAGGGLTKSGAGTLALTAVNTYTGPTIVSAGTLKIAGSGQLGSGSYSANITNSATFEYASSASQTFNGVLTNGTLAVTGSGTLTLNNSGTAFNTLTLSGNLDLASDINLGTVNNGGTALNGNGGTISSSGGRLLLRGGSSAVDGPNLYGGAVVPNVIEAVIADGSSAFDNVDFYNSGTIILKGANTYTGASSLFGTAVQVGVDSVGTVGAITSSAFGKGIMNFQSGANLSSDGTTPRTFLNPITIGNNVTLGHTNRTGKLTFDANTDLAAVRTLTLNSDVQFNGAITNTGGITKAGVGTLTLNGTNTYTGLTTVSAGTLDVTGSLADNAAVTVNGATAVYTVSSNDTVGAVTLTLGTINGPGALSGSSYSVASGNILVNLGGSGNLTKTAAGTVTLFGTNTFGGLTKVSAGTLQFAKQVALYNNDTAKWTKENISVTNGATLALNVGGPGEFTTNDVTMLLGNLSTEVNFNGLQNGSLIGFDTANAADGVFEINDVIANTTGAGGGSLGVVKAGTNTLILSGTNTYTGTTTVTAGTLKLANATVLPSATTLTVGTAAGGTLDLNGNSFTVTGMGAGHAAGTITDNSFGSGTSTLNITNLTTLLATLVVDGTNGQKVALRIANRNGNPQLLNSGNTFSGGLTLVGSYSRHSVGSTFVNTGTAGAIVSSPFGRGPITIGETANDRAQLFCNTVPMTILNDIIFNSSLLGTDRVGSLRLDTSLTLAGTLTANLAPINFAAATEIAGGQQALLTGRLTGPGANGGLLLKDSTAASGEVVTLRNLTGTPNDYSGSTVIESKNTLVLGASDQIPNGAGKGDVSVAGKFILNGFNETINGLSGSGTIDGGSGSPVLTIGDNNGSFTFTGVITNSAGSLSLVKTGSGNFNLNMTTKMAYSGATIVREGTLTLAPAAESPVAGMARWFDASSPANVTTNASGGITQWNDLSGNGAHAVNGTGTRLPTYAINALNGLGAVQCSPTNTATDYGQYLSFTQDASIRTVFSVFKGTSHLLTDTGVFHFYRPSDTDPTSPLWHSTSSSSNIRGGTNYVNGVIVNGTTYAMPTNSNNGFNLVEVLATNIVTASSFNNDRNSKRSGLQYHAEVLIYNRVLTEQERIQNEGYLSAKWLSDYFMALPTGTVVTVLSGATLDLNGERQTVSGMSGGGSFSNGTLTVTGSIGLTNGVAETVSVSTKLIIGTDATLAFDQSAVASDVVNVTGTLVLQGTNTVYLNSLDARRPPFQITLFTFETLTGDANLKNWTVSGQGLEGYGSRILSDGNSVYVNVFSVGTMIRFF